MSARLNKFCSIYGLKRLRRSFKTIVILEKAASNDLRAAFMVLHELALVDFFNVDIELLY